MLRPLWSRIKDTIYNAVASAFYTQSEIDDNIETRFTDAGVTYTTDSEDVSGYKRRNRQFFNAEDALHYIEDGIPKQYVLVLAIADWDDEGNTVYFVFVEEG